MKRILAAATVAFFVSTVVVVAPDGRVELGVESADAARYRSVERPDLIFALAMSLIVPGSVHIVYSSHILLGILFLVAAIGVSIAAWLLIAVANPAVATLVAILLYMGVGGLSFLDAKSRIYRNKKRWM